MWASIEDNHIKRRWRPHLYQEARYFSFCVHDQGGADQVNFVCTTQRHLVAAGYHSTHPDWCPSLTPDHRCCRRMLAGWQAQKLESSALISCDIRWWIQVDIYHFCHRPRELYLFLGYNNPLAFQQNDEKPGDSHCNCRGCLWLHQQITYETSAGGSSFGVCVPTSGGGGDG